MDKNLIIINNVCFCISSIFFHGVTEYFTTKLNLWPIKIKSVYPITCRFSVLNEQLYADSFEYGNTRISIDNAWHETIQVINVYKWRINNNE